MVHVLDGLLLLAEAGTRSGLNSPFFQSLGTMSHLSQHRAHRLEEYHRARGRGTHQLSQQEQEG